MAACALPKALSSIKRMNSAKGRCSSAIFAIAL
eukprot:CAMPEP_0170438898 /NCGR_PEP_ID=MMETSP0117_2-20130122/45493_1 /TAXON_ID=400756 /ORGANISM="Durinskia baltica, Strain CSIRO CS-38" /LENGTH=32 /DNA_ID= /DNA_START= /DNA_END= /DNA_ORIENTATION=